MKKTLFLVSCVLISLSAIAQYQLPKLNYSYSALEPYIDSTTMYIHYNNHHGAYTKNLNDALAKYPELQKKPLSEIFANMDQVPADIKTAIRNSGGGYFNHVLFWELMTPASKSKMSGYVEQELVKAFGTVDKFKEAFEKAATTRFGSGWAWLIKDSTGKYRIISTPNQDNPLMSAIDVKGEPVLAIDVWEHAYYLKYQSKRAEYVKNFWNIVNWAEVEKRMKK